MIGAISIYTRVRHLFKNRMLPLVCQAVYSLTVKILPKPYREVDSGNENFDNINHDTVFQHSRRPIARVQLNPSQEGEVIYMRPHRL